MNRFCAKFGTAFLCTIFITQCSRDNGSKPSEGSGLEEIVSRRDFYLSLSSQVQDRYGWTTDSKCDGLLHNSLFVYGGGTTDVFLARDEATDGWYRYPKFSSCCPPNVKSCISRDMLLGLLFVLYADRDLDSVERLIRYDEDHDGVMGESDGSLDGRNRVTMTPILRSTIHQMREYLGGEKNRYRHVPEVWSRPSGYRAHLEVLHILIRGMIFPGGVTDFGLATLKHHANSQPDNALFSAVYHKFKDGRQKNAIEILLRADKFPADRLPESRDRCAPYLFMHEQTPEDWAPCPKEKKTHSGTDFIFTTEVITDVRFGFSAR